MSTEQSTALTAPTNTEVATQNKTGAALMALDAFYEEKGLALMSSVEGGFTRAVNMAESYTQLRAMLTPEVLKPIMALQGSSLGFKTDKIYGEDVVKDALIEGTIKGFYPVNNELNILAGRQYSTKEGFHGWFRRASEKGRCTFPIWKLSVPKMVSDGAVVTGTISCEWGKKKIELTNEEIPIKVNERMGADAILGKAERKLFARLYARCTGQVASDGDLSDGAMEVTATPVAENNQPTTTATPPLAAKTLEDLELIVGPHEQEANAYLLSSGSIQAGQTFRNIPEKMATRIIKQRASFFEAIGVK